MAYEKNEETGIYELVPIDHTKLIPYIDVVLKTNRKDYLYIYIKDDEDNPSDPDINKIFSTLEAYNDEVENITSVNKMNMVDDPENYALIPLPKKQINGELFNELKRPKIPPAETVFEFDYYLECLLFYFNKYIAGIATVAMLGKVLPIITVTDETGNLDSVLTLPPVDMKCNKVTAKSTEGLPSLVYRFLGESQREDVDEFVDIIYRYELNFLNHIKERDRNIILAQQLKNFLRQYQIGVTIGRESEIEARDAIALQLFLFYT